MQCAMRSDSVVVRAPAFLTNAHVARLLAFLEREAGPVSLLCVATALGLLMIPHVLLLDGWLTLVSGREVVQNGLPSVDTLTVLAQGATWVDQQWLAQAVYYGLWSLGGIKLVMLGNLAVVSASLALALLAARRLGGSPRNVALVGAAAGVVAPWAIQMRAQTLVLPLFVLLLWLLAADSRAPSRRVLLCLPLLVLWANLHGSVVLAAGFVALRGVAYAVTGIRGGARPRDWLPLSAVLVTAPVACVFVSPYGLDLRRYYDNLLFNANIRAIAPEWAASGPSVVTAAFYALAGTALWLLARRRSRLTGFEQSALLGSSAVGASAIRSLIWFAITAAILVPRLLDAKPAADHLGRTQRLLLAAAVAVSFVSVGAAVAQPAGWYTASWPQPAAERVARLAAERPSAKIFSDGRFASWLLWVRPELAGRISHDVRWELYTDAQFRALLSFDEGTAGWRRATSGYELLVLDRQTHPRQIAELRREGLRTAWANERLVVLERG